MRCTFTLFALASAVPAQSTPYVTIAAPPGAVQIGFSAATGDDLLHVVWASQPNSLQYNRSADHGRTWLSTPPSFPTATNGVALAASGPNVYLFHSGLAASVSCSSSIDGGLTWRPPAPLAPTVPVFFVPLANGTSVHALLWESATSQLSYTRSTNAGLTWSTNPVVLGSANYSAPQLAMVGTTLHAAWAGNAGIQHVRSLDGGLTWQPVQVLAPITGQIAQVALVASAASVCLAFVPGQNQPVSLLRSVDAGMTWQGPSTISTGIATGVVGAGDGNGICFAWMPGTSVTVMEALSSDAGQTWQSSLQQPSSYLTTNAVITSLVYRNSSIAIALQCVDYFLPAWVAYPGVALVSKDRGATWFESAPIGTFLQGVRNPALLPAADSLVMVWGSAPNGYTIDRLQSTLVFGYQPYGIAKPGTGNIAPQLNGSGEPHMGSTISVAVSNARGGTPALIAASFGGPAGIPFGSGLLLVQPPTINLVGATSGTVGAPGAGSFAFPVAIPLGMAFLAQRLDFQGFVLDPAAADGFAATGGLELWTL